MLSFILPIVNDTSLTQLPYLAARDLKYSQTKFADKSAMYVYTI